MYKNADIVYMYNLCTIIYKYKISNNEMYHLVSVQGCFLKQLLLLFNKGVLNWSENDSKNFYDFYIKQHNYFQHR